MRYPCVGFPACMKTFENGHVLRGHHLSCEHALKRLSEQNYHDEQMRAMQQQQPPHRNQTKANKCFQKFTGLDNTQKFLIRDRYQLGGSNNPQESYRKIRHPPDPSMVIIQTKSSSIDFSGYYT